MKRRLFAFGRSAVVVTAVVILAVSLSCAGGRTLVAAHRGGAALAPENSLAAFRNAIALGADILEFDLHLTRDGEIVVIHDPTLDRTTTMTGAVRDRSLAELAAAKLKSSDGAVTEERVPTFAQVLDLAKPMALELLPEIKIGADRAAYPGIEEKVIAILRAKNMLGRSSIQAFQPETIRRLRQIEPSVRTMFLVSRNRAKGHQPIDAVTWARDAGSTDLGIDHRLVDASLVAAARAAKIRLSAWTVNDEGDMARMLVLGIDVIMSDRPDLVLKLRRG